MIRFRQFTYPFTRKISKTKNNWADLARLFAASYPVTSNYTRSWASQVCHYMVHDHFGHVAYMSHRWIESCEWQLKFGNSMLESATFGEKLRILSSRRTNPGPQADTLIFAMAGKLFWVPLFVVKTWFFGQIYAYLYNM